MVRKIRYLEIFDNNQSNKLKLFFEVEITVIVADFARKLIYSETVITSTVDCTCKKLKTKTTGICKNMV